MPPESLPVVRVLGGGGAEEMLVPLLERVASRSFVLFPRDRIAAIKPAMPPESPGGAEDTGAATGAATCATGADATGAGAVAGVGAGASA